MEYRKSYRERCKTVGMECVALRVHDLSVNQ